MMTKEGKKIWGSEEGASLMTAMLGQKPMNQQDWTTTQRTQVLKSYGFSLPIP